MTTRTKLALCAGLLAVAVGVAVVFFPAQQVVEGKFVRYTDDGGAVLSFTNRGAVPVRCFAMDAWLSDVPRTGKLWTVVVMPQCTTQIFASPRAPQGLHWPTSGATVTFHCGREPSELLQRIGALLRKVGIYIVKISSEVSVTLPPRATNAPAQPVTP